VGEKVGKLTIPPSRLADAGGEAFRGFDRTPYLAAFEAGRLTLLLANVHSFYGGSDNKNIERRAGETRAIAWWCDKRSDDPHAYTRDILALGDFNLPRAEAGDPIYDELTRRGPASARVPDEDRHHDRRATASTTRWPTCPPIPERISPAAQAYSTSMP